PSRGEGWGRPYMEAMASGLPTIGTRASGNLDFMHDGNAVLIDAVLTPVPDEAVREIPVYAGQSWYDPSAAQLRGALQRVARDGALRERISRQAIEDVRRGFSLEAGT